MSEMMDEFLIESNEGLDLIDRHLVALEREPNDPSLLTEIFRALHTLKGSSGFHGLDRVEQLAHSAENLLTLLRDGDLGFGPAIANALLATVDALRSIMNAIERTGEEGDPEVVALVARLDALADGGTGEVDTSWTEVAAGTEGEPTDPDDRTSDVPATSPAPPKRDPSPRIGDVLVADGLVERDDVELAAAEQGLGDQRPIGEILIDQGKASPQVVEAAAAAQTKQSSLADSTIRVDVGLLDRLMNLVGELVLSRNELVQLAVEHDDQVFGPPSQRLNLITSELQEGIMKTRMQPINSAWAKLPRVVRDLSHQLGKEVVVEMRGRETELDRTIIEAIKDPLTHVVRNTVDHGIEDPATREAAGKAAEGTLILAASHEGEQVNIEISDDGGGIDPERIKAKALESGLIGGREAEDLSDEEIINLIFRPGFSTAEAVTNISGRGVGMDVVKSNVERIGGSVEVRSRVGQGTTFTIKIPLTLAIIPALTIRLAENRYAIPQVNVLELVRLRAGGEERIEDIHGAPVFRLRGKLLPIVDLREQLGAPPIESRTTNIAVVKTETLRFGLVVDGIEDNGEIVVKPLSQQVKDLRLFSGATILGDGKVALILDLLGLADQAGLSPGSATLKEVEAQQATEERGRRSLDTEALIVLSVGGGERVAIGLNEIDRLEEIPATSIERSDSRPVVQYRGTLMPLVDLGQVIGVGGSVLDDHDRVNIVVCLSGDRTVGLAVDQILDIVHTDAVRPSGQPGTVIVDGLVTDLVSPETIIAAALPSLHHVDPAVASRFEGDWAPVGAVES